MGRLDDLLRRCTVRVLVAGGSFGSGAFVAPGLALTCAHVVEVAWPSQAGVTLHWAGQDFSATIDAYCAKHAKPLRLLILDHLGGMDPGRAAWRCAVGCGVWATSAPASGWSATSA